MKNAQGFTLIEIMIAMTIFAIVAGGVYQTYIFQQKAYLKHEQVVEMQQNLRAGLFFVSSDAKLAGFDSCGESNATIRVATRAQLEFEVDQNGDGSITTDEIIRYGLIGDPNQDGIAENTTTAFGLGKVEAPATTYPHGMQVIADNVQALEFCYVLKSGIIKTEPAAGELSDIRAVYISLLARSKSRIKERTTAITFVPASNNTSLVPTSSFSGTLPPEWQFNDQYGRNLSVVKVRFRNMGANPFAD